MKIYQIRLTDAQLGVIGAALAEMPYRAASPVINDIQNQMAVMDTPPAPVEEPNDIPTAP